MNQIPLPKWSQNKKEKLETSSMKIRTKMIPYVEMRHRPKYCQNIQKKQKLKHQEGRNEICGTISN